MVKLEGLTREEIERRDDERRSKEEYEKYLQLKKRFLRIAEEMFNPPFLSFFKEIYIEYVNSSYLNIYLGSGQIAPHLGHRTVIVSPCSTTLSGRISMNVHDPSQNIIKVYKSGSLDDALRLARAYEEVGFGEFTVKKEYEE